MAKAKTGTRRRRGVTGTQRGRRATVLAGEAGRDGARRESGAAVDRDGGRLRGVTRTARRELSTPRMGHGDDDGSNTRSRAAARERDSRPETAADSDLREGDNPRAASAEPGARRAQPAAE